MYSELKQYKDSLEFRTGMIKSYTKMFNEMVRTLVVSLVFVVIFIYQYFNQETPWSNERFLFSIFFLGLFVIALIYSTNHTYKLYLKKRELETTKTFNADLYEKGLYYDLNSEKFIEISKNYDMSKFYNFCEVLFKKYNIEKVVDLGFGSARDMLYFISKGYVLTGLDRCENFVLEGIHKSLNVYASKFPLQDNEFTSESLLAAEKGEQLTDSFYAVGVLEHLNLKDRDMLIFLYGGLFLRKNGLFIVSYLEGDRSNDETREFYPIDKENVFNSMKNAGLSLVKSENITDSTGRIWKTEAYKKD